MRGVEAINAENKHLADQAVNAVGDSAPGEQFVEEIPEFTLITNTPRSPDFEATGGLYTSEHGNWATEGGTGGKGFGRKGGECTFIASNSDTSASANPADLQEFVDGSKDIEQDFTPTVEGTQGHWRFVLNTAGRFVPTDLKNPLFDCENVIDAWESRREFVTDVRRAFIKADEYDPTNPDNTITVPSPNVDAELRDDEDPTDFEIQADKMVAQTAEELNISEAEAERILVEELNDPFLHESEELSGLSIGDQAGGSEGDPATLPEILEAIADGSVIIESQEPDVLIDPSGNSPEDVAEYLQHVAVTSHLERRQDEEGPSLEQRNVLRERFFEQRKLEKELFGIPDDFDFEKLHEELDIIGFVPVFGEVADGINGLLYLYEGDYVNAGISVAALIPIGGQLATGTRVGKRIATAKVSKEIVQEIARTEGKLIESFATSDGAVHIVRNKNGKLVTITESSNRPLVYGNHAFKDADGIWHHQPGPRGKTVPDIPQRPAAKAPDVNDPTLQSIMDALHKGGYNAAGNPNPNRIGDGTAMDAARNEQLTGSATEGASHTIKISNQLNRLNKWVKANPNPSPDLDVANQLIDEIESVGGFK